MNKVLAVLGLRSQGYSGRCEVREVGVLFHLDNTRYRPEAGSFHTLDAFGNSLYPHGSCASSPLASLRARTAAGTAGSHRLMVRRHFKAISQVRLVALLFLG